MPKKNIEVEIFRYKNTIFGSILYVDPRLMAQFPNDEIVDVNNFCINTTDYEQNTELEENEFTFSTELTNNESNGYSVYNSFSYDYDDEKDAIKNSKLFVEAVAKINAMQFKEDKIIKAKAPGEIMTILTAN